MRSRRTQILDAATAIVGGQGMRALTHRAVDAAAGVPQGSTSNYFRTREALVGAVVEHVSTQERAAFDDLAAAATPRTPQELAALLARFAIEATGPRRELTLARFAILVETAIHPELRRRVREVAAEVISWGTAWLRAVGSTDPVRDFGFLGNYLDGVTLHQLVQPDPAFDPEPELVTLVDALVGLGERVTR